MITYGSVCSGIEAASVAWEPLGFRPSWFSQFDPEHNYKRGPDFPSAVLAHHWPHVANLGDMTLIADAVSAGFIEAPDVLVGGTPCQAFSVAGLRGGLSDGRGFLTLKFVELADAIDKQRPGNESIIVWENVPGVLSSKDNAFGCFLAGLAGESEPLVAPGGKWSNAGCVSGPSRTIAWRVLDAQYFGVAQRRRRVFVVASAREGFDPTAVLFEFDGVRRDSAPSREAREETAGATGAGADQRGKWPAEIACTLNAAFGSKQGIEDHHVNGGCPLFVPVETYHLNGISAYATGPGTLRATSGDCGGGSEMLAVSVVHGTQDPCVGGDLAFALGCNNGGENVACYGFQPRIGRNGRGDMGDLISSLTAYAGETGKGDAAPCVAVCVTGDVTHTLKAEGFDGSEDGTGRGQPIVTALAHVDVMPTMVSGGSTEASHNQMSGQFREEYLAPTNNMQVRRLTPTECERLQGFPDNHTLLPNRTADGPRYKALGNSMAVPVMRWIGNRILLHILGAL